MRFHEERKHSIILYLLKKIAQNDTGISKAVSDAFDINQATVHSYINELLDQNIITKVKRGEYRLVTRQYPYVLKRSEGDLNTDTYAYDHCLAKHIEKYARNVQNIWSYTFSEMINNVMDHSGAEQASIIVLQDYLKTSVVIADNGIGIFCKIKDHFHLPTIDDAICELFKGKLTTDAENHSGEGIFFSSKMMDNFFIISSGKIFTNNIYDNSQIVNYVQENNQGTIVIMDLANYTHKEAREVFDLYTDVDGGFTKTLIPLKNIFDTSPVSRSQAKRVCNKLENFEEVVLDFQDISWMGQGFAHQLFVVFARNNPDIRLVPINMNEAVDKMYCHVLNS